MGPWQLQVPEECILDLLSSVLNVETIITGIHCDISDQLLRKVRDNVFADPEESVETTAVQPVFADNS